MNEQQNCELEVILVFNRAHDDLDAWLVEQDWNFKLTTTECLGIWNQHEARAAGLALATCEWVHLLDDDDFPMPDFYAKADLSGDMFFTVPKFWFNGKHKFLMHYEESYYKSNPSCSLYKTAMLRKTFATLPVDLFAHIEPLLYNLSYCHVNNPVVRSGTVGVHRGAFGGFNWKRDYYPPDHLAVWDYYLGLGKPQNDLSVEMSIYFDLYLAATPPWRKESK